MKILKSLSLFLLLSSNIIFAQKSDWGSWNTTPCFKGISFRVRIAENTLFSENRYKYEVEFKNNYTSTVSFSYLLTDQNSTNTLCKERIQLVSGATKIAWSLLSSSNNSTIRVYTEKACFEENGNCGQYNKQCYANCDNGIPNIPTDCNQTNKNQSSNTSQNSTGSSGTSSMNRGGNVVTGSSTNTNSEGTGWNGNNGSSNNNYNQQIQNQNTKTTEAFDLYNSTGNYEEAKRKLIEAKNNAPDEASRQVAQQNLDKLDKVEKRNQNVETISKTIDFTTDLIKTMREENKKSLEYASNYELEKYKNERLEKVKFYTNKIDNQQIKISNLEKIEKKFDDYINLIDEYKTMAECYSYLALYQHNDSKEEEKKYKNISEEYYKKSDQIIIEMYEKRFYFPHKIDIYKNNSLIYKILDIDNELLSDKIIENLKIDADKGNGKSAYEIAYISSNKINEILSISSRIPKKELSIDDINRYLQKLKYYLDLEFEYLNIAVEKQNKEAILVKNAYKMFGWYKEPRNVMEAQNAFKELIDKKTVEENYFSSVNFKFVENTENKKIYKPISQEFYNDIMEKLIDKASKFSVTKQVKKKFDDALLISGITKIPNIEFTKQYESSKIKYEIGDVYFNSNQILIVPKKLEILLLFEKFNNNIIFNDSDLYETIEENELKFNGWLKNDFSFYIRKEEDVINSYFFKLITNQIKN